MRDDASLRSEHERRVGVVARLVNDVQEWRSLIRPARRFPVAARAVGVEERPSLAVLGGRGRELDSGEDFSLALAPAARSAGGDQECR
jgi:hypothetical protein